MLQMDALVLYVKNIEISKSFYEKLFLSKGVLLSPSFASFSLESGIVLQLKQLDQASPPSKFTGGGAELSLLIKNAQSLMQLYERWSSKHVKFVQKPTELVFGLTFVAVDPDGHRIRVWTKPET